MSIDWEEIKRQRKKYSGKDVLIFLDIDGVLNTSNSFNTKYEIFDTNVVAFGKLCAGLVKMGHTPKVILTSTWRLGFDSEHEKCSEQIKRLIAKLDVVGISIVGKTPVYKEKTRDMEIMRFIREYQLKEADFTYIILDDDISIFDKNVLNEMNFYKVNQNTGLTVKDVERILKMV